MRKMRKQPVGGYDPRGWDLEEGGRVFQARTEFLETEVYYMYDLKESTGRNKSACGELTPHLVKKNGEPRIGIRIDTVWYWKD